jgi:hypothetical protein
MRGGFFCFYNVKNLYVYLPFRNIARWKHDITLEISYYEKTHSFISRNGIKPYNRILAGVFAGGDNIYNAATN